MKNPILTLLSAVAVPLLLIGCGEDVPAIDCDTTDVPAYAEVSIWPSCTNCHASTLTGADRMGAPEGVDYDTYEAAVANADAAVEEVAEGKMPYPDGSGVSEEEKQSLYAWVECGTPE